MYIEPTTTYYKGTSQCTKRARFLLLVEDENRPSGPDNFRGIVRMVALEQLGHWMMGRARVAGETIIVSGSYGADGLVKSESTAVYNKGTDVPRELYDAWNKGGGWNGVGSEAEAMRKWALENF